MTNIFTKRVFQFKFIIELYKYLFRINVANF
jgi:hypothetical protein